MTETLDQLIQARFDAVANPLDTSDWDDVLARTRGSQHVTRALRVPRRLAIVAAAAVLGLAVTAVGFGWPQTFIDFFSSPPASANVKNWFGAENVAAPAGMDPKVIPDEARKITTATFDVNHLDGRHPIVHTLYVAPREGGGFCYLWTEASGGCLPAQQPPNLKTMGPLGLDWFADNENRFPVFISGWVRSGETKTVEARFADGTTETIPVTWVSAPVDAGFLVYPVPSVHQTRADSVTSVVALDADGSVIGRQDFHLTDPLDQDVMQTLPDGTKYSLPRRADAAHARKLVSFRSTTGNQVYLWVMPQTGGGECYLFNRGEGCDPNGSVGDFPELNGGLSGGAAPLLFFAQVKSDVAAVELQYQDGTSERLTPVDGFLLTEITPDHYEPGTRLAAAVALDQSGNTIYTQPQQPQAVGVYPCEKPVDLGYGVKSCP